MSLVPCVQSVDELSTPKVASTSSVLVTSLMTPYRKVWRFKLNYLMCSQDSTVAATVSWMRLVEAGLNQGA
jgi:hypothetical protein